MASFLLHNFIFFEHTNSGGISMEKFRPGEEAPKSCKYTAYDKNGKDGGKVYLNKGDRFPATQSEGSYYVMDC